MLTTFANQAALAIDRAHLIEETLRATALEQTDQLKSALLTAVSHDLRTPLASIKAAATSLLQKNVHWDEATRDDFLTAIDEETDRLTKLVSNFLDLSRIQGGALRPEKEWYDIAEVIGAVTRRLMPLLASHTLRVEITPNLPLLHFDYVEIAQVLANLIENAAKYSAPDTAITVSADAEDELCGSLWPITVLASRPQICRMSSIPSIACSGPAGPADRRHGHRAGDLQGIRRGAWRPDQCLLRCRAGHDLLLHAAGDRGAAGTESLLAAGVGATMTGNRGPHPCCR